MNLCYVNFINKNFSAIVLIYYEHQNTNVNNEGKRCVLSLFLSLFCFVYWLSSFAESGRQFLDAKTKESDTRDTEPQILLLAKQLAKNHFLQLRRFLLKTLERLVKENSNVINIPFFEVTIKDSNGKRFIIRAPHF